MKTLFKNRDGRLKTMRITVVVFILLMAGLAVFYKMGKSVDKMFVKIDHVFEAEKKAVNQKPKQEVTKARQAIEKKISEQIPEKKTLPSKDLKPRPKPKSEPEPALKPKPPIEKALAKQKNIPKPAPPKPELKPMPQKTADRSNPLELASSQYFEVYKEWQTQGEEIDEKSKRVGLKILNLENVYDLFQMKAVVVKEGIPHTDLDDHSRVADTALAEFSTTCFIVANPWEKWGSELKKSGFKQNDNLEIRYYTYDFVRNAIYARAKKAFEWSLAKENLPLDTDPAKADVLGSVYAVNRKGGGAFGVFVPSRVDFGADRSVVIDPLACFKGEKDIEALNRAGIL